ncbi:MAG: hypothetical protein FH751_14455 [Firmicutes bacterium]|nr:hypothetical protein [Bacillota bacterium]
MQEEKVKRKQVSTQFKNLINKSGILEDNNLSTKDLCETIKLQKQVHNLNPVILPQIVGNYNYNVNFKNYDKSEEKFIRENPQLDGSSGHQGVNLKEFSTKLKNLLTSTGNEFVKSYTEFKKLQGIGLATLSGYLYLYDPKEYPLVNRTVTKVIDSIYKQINKENILEDVKRDKNITINNIGKELKTFLIYGHLVKQFIKDYKIDDTHVADQIFWKLNNSEILSGSEGVKVEEKGYYENEEPISNSSFDNLNYILYGPPGTGKTYNSVIFAVSIIENKDINLIKNESYKEVKRRYDNYIENGQVVFNTFHQSYGYEDFVEALKPVLEGPEEENQGIHYKIESGIFKEICNRARLSQYRLNLNKDLLNENSKVWKISLNGSGKNAIKEDCFENNRIRIGWDQVNNLESDNRDFSNLSETDKKTVLKFYEELDKGDIVCSLYNQKNIDGVGIVTGEYVYDDELEEFKHTREVNWLVKGDIIDIYDKNRQTNLTQKTLYQLSRISSNDILELLRDRNLLDGQIKSETKSYVLIIDEVNRGNISKIFGELITLIESNKRIGEPEELKVTLPYSKSSFGVPKNLYIIGTMNTADRSIALMDTALRRRFQFIEMMPESDLLTLEDNSDLIIEGINIRKMLEKINERIEFLYDRDHMIGHSYFMDLLDTDKRNYTQLCSIFKNKIIPLLQEYFYGDWEKIQIILGDHYNQLIKMNNFNNISMNTREQEMNKYRFIQSQKSKEINIIGFNHDEYEDLIKYKINEQLKTGLIPKESFIKIYDTEQKIELDTSVDINEYE